MCRRKPAMKFILIALTLLTSFAQAAENPSPVPDSGGTMGLLAVGALAAVALRRSLRKK